MLKIHFYSEDIGKLEGYVHNVHMLFEQTRLDGCKEDRAIIQEVEKGEYLNELEFIDRFGYKLSIDCLSTGAKAALAVKHNPDKIVNCIEAGTNAISAILQFCRDGAIVIYDRCYVFPIFDDREDVVPIDVEYRGHCFRDLDSFNFYFEEEYPDEPSGEV